MLAAAAALELGRDLTDEDLVARTLGGDHRHFEVLMRRHNQRLFRTVRAIVRSNGDAEDALQAAYVAAFAALASFERRAAFATWLTRIAVNEALSRVREKRYERNDESDDRSAEGAHDPEVACARAELRRVLTRAIDDLPDALRRAFVLREIAGASAADAADALGITVDAVHVRVHRARAALRASIAETFDADDVRALFGFGLARCDRLVGAVLARIAEADRAEPIAVLA